MQWFRTGKVPVDLGLVARILAAALTAFAYGAGIADNGAALAVIFGAVVVGVWVWKQAQR